MGGVQVGEAALLLQYRRPHCDAAPCPVTDCSNSHPTVGKGKFPASTEVCARAQRRA
jgi:hypothetical protein